MTNFKATKLKNASKYIDDLYRLTPYPLVVMMAGGITKNNRANSQPKVSLFMQRLGDDGTLGSTLYLKVAITHLNMVQNGTIWEKGRCKSYLKYDEELFDVDFSQEGWVHEIPPLQDEYKMPYRPDKNWFIRFKLNDNKSLLVPCIEYFIKCYGRSPEVTRILTTYSWPEVHNRFFESFIPSNNPNVWEIMPKRITRNGDTVFLAHVMYDNYTKGCARSIFSQIGTQGDNDPNVTKFIKVKPWFQGKAKLLVQGIWLKNHDTFLALRIIGSSEPEGKEIKRLVNPKSRSNNEFGGDLDARTNNSYLNPSNTESSTGDEAAQYGTDYSEEVIADFILLGKPRKIINERGYAIDRTSHHSGEPSDTNLFSFDEIKGCDNQAAKFYPKVTKTLESKGALRDIWNALHKFPDQITNINYFTFESGFTNTGDPILIELEEFSDDEIKWLRLNNPRLNLKWPFVNKKTGELRGVLVVQFSINNKKYYIFEIQRSTSVDSKTGEIKEESIAGMIATIKYPENFSYWLPNLLRDIRYEYGVFKKLTGTIPGEASTFNHSKSNNVSFSGEAPLRNALRNFQIKLD